MMPQGTPTKSFSTVRAVRAISTGVRCNPKSTQGAQRGDLECRRTRQSRPERQRGIEGDRKVHLPDRSAATSAAQPNEKSDQCPRRASSICRVSLWSNVWERSSISSGRPAVTHRDSDAEIPQRHRQDVAAVVVGVFAQQVDPAGSPGGNRGRPAEMGFVRGGNADSDRLSSCGAPLRMPLDL